LITSATIESAWMHTAADEASCLSKP